MKALFAAVAVVALGYGLFLVLRPPAPTSISSTPAVVPADAAPAVRGAAVYVRYGCAACHGTDAKGGFANPNSETDGKVPGLIFVKEGYTRPELRQKILTGVGTIGKKDPKGPKPPYRMPGWAGQMGDQDASDLADYLFSLYPSSQGEKWR